ncbi:M15 family metallopeptidase [Spongisporangium articulatum]|uniref:M15 family metallopeptidase n=1 Tax=Spongisporangium articulatum TaxID=3362603 RepID=A0ABW8ATV5_9ACTN
MNRSRCAVAVALAVLVGTTSACGSAGSAPSTPSSGATTTPALPSSTGPSAVTTPSPTPALNGATPAPSWLGTRVLKTGSSGFGIWTGRTPKSLAPRRIITVDLLPPPADGRFHAHVVKVPADVLARSTWSARCPVAASQLRYVTVSFRGFDGRAHTGELLVNRSVATDLVTVFRKLFAAGWPIEQMRITSQADLDAKPTGDGNVTAAFACRPVRGATSWSQHAYGLAVDLDPFQNPYVSGSTVLPELARSYTDRRRGWPGIITRNSAPVKAFRSIGWGWGGDYSSKKDFMHFSSTGG